MSDLDAQTDRPGGRPDLHRSLGVLALALVVLIGVALGANRVGLSARSLEPTTSVCATGGDVVTAARGAMAHGVVALVASREFGYALVPISSDPNVLKWPVEARDLDEVFRQGADRDSWARTLAKTGVARRIDYLLPPAVLQQRVLEGRSAGFPGIAADGLSISANDDGYWRFMASSTRDLDEPLLLVIDASYFENGSRAELLEALTAADIRPRALIAYRAEDDTTVPEAARVSLDEALPSLKALVE